MGYVRLNVNSIRKKALSTNKAREKAVEKAEKKVQEEKQILINSFENHEVTKEIIAGPKANNSSGTLGGYGNLFSFIGFESGSDPISPIKDLLAQIKLNNLKYRDGKFTGTVKYPSQNEIKDVSPLPFEGGKSWVAGIENGISGFTHYIYTRFLSGRSKEGAQIKGEARPSIFRKKKYLNSLIEDFINNIKGK